MCTEAQGSETHVRRFSSIVKRACRLSQEASRIHQANPNPGRI
jgi:hypothetical protein